MKPAKLAVIGVAALAGLSAVWLTSGLRQTKEVVVEAPREQIPTDEVLVVASNLPMGVAVKPGDLRWQAWPKASVSSAMITRSAQANALEHFSGSIVRSPFLAGEPVRPEKLIKGDNAGFLSAILPSGRRAVAINIASSGARSAGGFILPNDRVDVIRTARDDDATRSRSSDVFASETILQNIRVLAIGQNVQERNGEKVVIGETATLELDPRQAEIVTLAQRIGELSLVLRSMADANQPAAPIGNDGESGNTTIVRFGVTQNVGRR